MALARVVEFEGVSQDRMEALTRDLNEGGPTDDVPASEILMLHDPEAGRSVAILIFETKDDYDRADATLNAMPSDETPGRRTSVSRYAVAVHRKA
jgi:hypothetical protein